MRPSPLPSPAARFSSSIIAMLGPTNTGKTHQATMRMLEHESGMMGLPLRLLAREVYDKVCAIVGAQQVALVTGEERHIPEHPRFWVCTVEAMPQIDVDFLAVDEIQLAAHHERGHIFSDRLLNWRGTKETWFLGAETIRPMLQQLVPTAQLERKPRLSVLRSVGNATLGQLPPRTAVVAFSAARVYEIAERIRVKRGGAAVVLGALSPRARSAQVAMYQAGEVDFLVATDAIGMGLNMNVDCVAFAELKKFDGRQNRILEDSEMAQIAGRAGRNRNDGSFCTLAPLQPLPYATQRAIEEHRFSPISRVYWRNHELQFGSTETLLQSLGTRPFAHGLMLNDHAEDQLALARLTRRGDIQELAVGQDRVRLLWQVCQIPDFRKLLLDDHFELLATVYLQLCQRGTLDPDWVSRQVERLDDVNGELDALLVRMAAIRTWTFITHRTDWLNGALQWQERTLAIEDHLSDALHEQLVSRFVGSVGRRGAPNSSDKNQRKPEAAAKVRPFQVAHRLSDLTTMLSVASPAQQEREETQQWKQAPNTRFTLRADGRICDADTEENAAVAKLVAGTDLLRPELVMLANLPSGLSLGIRERLANFLAAIVDEQFGILQNATSSNGSRAWRAVLYGLRKGLGSVLLSELDEFVFEDLQDHEHKDLHALGFRKHHQVAFLTSLATPKALGLRWALLAPYWPAPRSNAPLPTLPEDSKIPAALKLAAGYEPQGTQWVHLGRVRRLRKRRTIPSMQRR